MPHLFSTTADVECSLQAEQHLIQMHIQATCRSPHASLWCKLMSLRYVQHPAGANKCHETCCAGGSLQDNISASGPGPSSSEHKKHLRPFGELLDSRLMPTRARSYARAQN